jgi:hypothetical protein
MKPALFAAVFACLLSSLPAGAQETRLLPVDEAAKDPSWTSFRNRLLDALARRDRKFVLSILDRNVRSGVESGRGVAEFRKQWELDSNSSPLWQELPAALFLGGAYVKHDQGPSELCAPYVSVRWPQDIDAFGGGAIVAKEVFVKTAPAAASETLATLSYDIVEVRDWEVADRSADSKQKWVRIRLRQGEGYVPEERIRSPIEHTACFVKSANGWRMTGFGPGSGK